MFQQGESPCQCINSAKDDAAGQAIANRMSSQITGLAQAQRNANDGISVAQTAEGGLNQINDNLQRIRELAVQAENGTNSSQDLDSIQNEINQRLEEIDRISRETDFNGTKVLGENEGATDPALRTISIQVGAQDGQTIDIDLQQINRQTLGLEGFNVTGGGEVANEAATRDDLVLAGFELDTTFDTEGVQRFTNDVDNTAATASDFLDRLETGDQVSFDQATTGFNVAATGNNYTFDADSNSFNFDAAGVATADVAANLRPATGETNTATFTIDGSDQEVNIDSEGNLTHSDSGAQLYITEDGLLSQNGSGSRPVATLDTVLASMADVAAPGAATVSETTAGDGSTAAVTEITFEALTAGQSYTIDDGGDGLTLTATQDMTADEVAATFNQFVDDGTSINGAEFEGNLDAYGDTGIDSATVAGATVTLTATVGATPTLTVAAAGSTGTGGSISVGDTTITANGEEFDVTGASIGAEQLMNRVEGNAFQVTQDPTGDNTTSYFNTDGEAFTDAGFTAANQIYVNANEALVTEATSEIERFVQEGNGGIVTDGSARQVFVDGDGDFTFDATTEAERSSLGELDDALSQVDALRSDLGAIQNRMESAIDNLSTTETNLSAARSRIEDADYAVEVASMTRAQILQQAGTSVLAQANQIPQNVLSLLG